MENKLKIIIQDELTINNAAEIYKLLAEGLQHDGDLQISIPAPLPVDVTFMQILHAFMEKCKSVNKKVYFIINSQNEFISALIRMGYYDLAGIFEPSENKVEG
ncbi:MAG TPA: hypothetical protein VGK38_06580 [Prolixibacteraceae bacterium]